MAQNKIVAFPPVALSSTLTTNILAPGAAPASAVGWTSTAPYLLIKHIRIVNKTAGAVTFSLYVGATGANAAGTEFMGTASSIAANSSVDWYGQLRLEGTNGFLVGGASATTSLVFQCEGEVGLV